MLRKIVVLATAAVLVAAAAGAQESVAEQIERIQAELGGLPASAPAIDKLGTAPPYHGILQSGVACTGGIAYDDGTFEDGVRTTSTHAHNFVMAFDLPGGTNRIDAICTSWSRSGNDLSATYRLNVYAADGPGGAPGTLLGYFTPNTTTPPKFSFEFFRAEIPGGLQVPGSRVYVGPAWSELLDDDFFLGVDENGPGGHAAYFGTDLVAAPATRDTDPAYRALGIRVEAAATSNCLPSATALCLGQRGRFKVEATYATSAGQSGSAQVVKLTDETGYLWFFGATNVEAVVKVLDACTLNSRFWVFAGGLTDVNVVLTVTDTETGVLKTYTNPQGKKFQPIQDTGAFATCP